MLKKIDIWWARSDHAQVIKTALVALIVFGMFFFVARVFHILFFGGQ